MAEELDINFEEERDYWQKKLEEGDINAYYALSRLYEYSGKMEEAAKYFLKALTAGQADALYWLSKICLDKTKDFYAPEESENYLRQAADGGCTEAMIELGDKAVTETDKQFYEVTEGTPDEKAQHFVQFEWYKKAAMGGDMEKVLHIANAYRNGYPVPQNDDKAFEWYMRGVEVARDLACVCPLAECFVSGCGVEADAETAVELYSQAAEYGVAEAIEKLAEIFTNGLGEVEPDPEKAAEYFSMLK